jgi:hypothetical protein
VSEYQLIKELEDLEDLGIYTANEGLVDIQYKCLVPIYVFPEMNLLFQN